MYILDDFSASVTLLATETLNRNIEIWPILSCYEITNERNFDCFWLCFSFFLSSLRRWIRRYFITSFYSVSIISAVCLILPFYQPAKCDHFSKTQNRTTNMSVDIFKCSNYFGVSICLVIFFSNTNTKEEYEREARETKTKSSGK